MSDPRLTIAALSPKEFQIFTGPPNVGEDVLSVPNGTVFDYNPTGTGFVHCHEKEIRFYENTEAEPVQCRADADIARVSFSPKGKYCVTHEPVLERLRRDHKNLKVWSCEDGELAASFHQKGVTEETWPFIQFDAEETHVFFTVKDAIVLYKTDGDMAKADRKVPLQGITLFSMGPSSRKHLAAFVPESSKPAVFALIDWSDGSTINRKSFHRANRCRFEWNQKGSHVLCQSIADFDKTNKSYYGESRLYLLSSDGRTDMAVAMDDDPSIVDFAWAPDGASFVALGGHQPTCAVLYSAAGKVLSKMVSGPYNTVRWAPNGRFILLAGFGNLPGDIQLIEKTEKGPETMGACRSECSVQVEWSPCSRYFLTASVAPRMRVDNRITIYTYYGKQIHELKYDVLQSARWAPIPKEKFPDRGVSPERLEQVAAERKKGVDATIAAKKAAYVPSHMRGVDGQRTKKVEGWDADIAAERIRNMVARKEATRVPVGYEAAGDVPAKGLSKNAKKRAAKKAKKADDGEAAGAEEAVDAMANVAIGGGDADGAAAGGENTVADPAKRIRNLKKRLAKIETAKEKQAKGEKLTPEQEELVRAEASVKEELKALATPVS